MKINYGLEALATTALAGLAYSCDKLGTISHAKASIKKCVDKAVHDSSAAIHKWLPTDHPLYNELPISVREYIKEHSHEFPAIDPVRDAAPSRSHYAMDMKLLFNECEQMDRDMSEEGFYLGAAVVTGILLTVSLVALWTFRKAQQEAANAKPPQAKTWKKTGRKN